MTRPQDRSNSADDLRGFTSDRLVFKLRIITGYYATTALNMTRTISTSKSIIAGTVLATASMAAALAADLSAVPSGKYEVDPTHAYINFSYNHLGLSNPTLSFDDFTVDMELNNEDPTQSSI